MRRLFALWFALTERIDRKTYLGHGAVLMALKYAGDCAIVRLGAGRVWTPLDYVNPMVLTREQSRVNAPTSTPLLAGVVES